MFICNDCGCMFEEPDTRRTTYEAYYGVYSEFGSHTPFYLDICPCCGSDEFGEAEIEEECT